MQLNPELGIRELDLNLCFFNCVFDELCEKISSLVEAESAIISASSVVLSAMVVCILLCHVMGTSAYMMTKPVRDLAVFGSYMAWFSLPLTHSPLKEAST